MKLSFFAEKIVRYAKKPRPTQTCEKHKKVILQNIFYAADVANLCKRKSESTRTGWCFKFYDWRKINFSFERLFSPHIDHFQLIMMVHSKSLKKQINQFPERALHILKIDTMFYSKDSSKTVR